MKVEVGNERLRSIDNEEWDDDPNTADRIVFGLDLVQ